LTVTDKQTIRKILNKNHKNTHINTIQIKESKQLNIQQKQNYPHSVAFYDSQPGNEEDLFYNGPEHHTGLTQPKSDFTSDYIYENCQHSHSAIQQYPQAIPVIANETLFLKISMLYA